MQKVQRVLKHTDAKSAIIYLVPSDTQVGIYHCQLQIRLWLNTGQIPDILAPAEQL